MDLVLSLAHLSAIHILMAMIPGPNTVVVSHMAASRSRAAGLAAALGIMLASLIWVSLSLAGIGVLLVEAGMAYNAARLAGACYLVYAGWRLLRAAARGGATGAIRPFQRRHGPFVAGLLTTLSNPKSAAFWTSIFALVVPAGAPAWFYGAVVLVVAAQSLGWYGFVALMLSSAAARRHYARLARWIDGIAGGVMVLLGLHLADELRREIAVRVL